MSVPTKHQRKGIASALVRHLIAHAREQGLKEIVLGTSEFQQAAIELYKRGGFEEGEWFQVTTWLKVLELRMSLE